MQARIHTLRKEHKLSQEAFGAKLKITGPSVSRIESGKSNPSDQTVALICQEFDVTEHWLRTGEEPKHPVPDPQDELMQLVEQMPATKQLLIDIVKHMPIELMDQVIREMKLMRSRGEK